MMLTILMANLYVLIESLVHIKYDSKSYECEISFNPYKKPGEAGDIIICVTGEETEAQGSPREVHSW